MRQRHQKPTERDLRHIPEPTFVYEVGERVQYGNWNYAKILEIHEDGKFYKCYIETDNIQYGKNLGLKTDEVYLYWIDLKPYRPLEEIDQIEILQEDQDIRFNYSQRQIESILLLLYKDTGLDLNPDYQRGNVWSQDQKVALIESIFKNVDR